MCLAKVERYLESHGWTRQVAGDADFDAAVLAVGKMAETGKGEPATWDGVQAVIDWAVARTNPPAVKKWPEV